MGMRSFRRALIGKRDERVDFDPCKRRFDHAERAFGDDPRACGRHERLPRFAFELLHDRNEGLIVCADAGAAEFAPEAEIKKQVIAGQSDNKAASSSPSFVKTELGCQTIRVFGRPSTIGPPSSKANARILSWPLNRNDAVSVRPVN